MNRRGFLQGILALGVAPAIVRAESLMKVSGIVLPTDEECAAVFNSLLTPQMITREALKILERNLIAANIVNRKFERQFVKIGSVLTIRKPIRFAQ